MTDESRDHAPSVTAVTSGQSHTPGPWCALSGRLVYRGDRQIASADSPYVGVFEAKANARLIAAAPDLLEALKEVDSWRKQSLDKMPPEVRGAWMRAHAAIAKAEGRSHD